MTLELTLRADAADRLTVSLDAQALADPTPPAEQGELLFLVGGDEDDVAACRPLFESMGRGVVHLGGQGMGASLKMVFNSLLGQAMLVFSEAMALGQAPGLGEEQLLETLVGSALVPPFIAGKRSKIETGDYEADFPLQWMRKDLQLASQAAYQAGVAAPAVNVAKEVYALAVQNGWGEKDFSAIYQFLNDQG